MSAKYEVHGFCDERFSLVKEEFAKNFEHGIEVGATFAATLNGEFVVDIWAGFSDSALNKPWEKDTIVNVWSTTKIMAAICTHMLADRNLLDLDATVSHYWPEFAQSGKESILVRHLLSHQAGLSTFDQSLSKEAIFDWDLMAKTLAAQKTDWEPGSNSGYHAFTQGFLLGELIRRITGKTLGKFFHEEIAAPLNVDFYIGLPDELESRVAEIIPPSEPRAHEPGSLAEKSNPVDLTADIANMQEWRKAEIPAANGHSNARSVAKILSVLACGGEIGGIRLLSEKAIEKVYNFTRDSNQRIISSSEVQLNLF